MIFLVVKYSELPVCKGIISVLYCLSIIIESLLCLSSLLLYNNQAPGGFSFWLLTHLHQAMPASGTV